jgi:hypothetical protein
VNATVGFLCLALFVPAAAAADLKPGESKRLAQKLQTLVNDNAVVALRGFIAEIAELDEPEIVVLIPPAATAVPSSVNYEAAVKALAALKNEKSVAALAELVVKPKLDFRQKVLVLEAFGWRSDEASIKAVVKGFEVSNPHVQAAAIRACVARRSREPIPALIDLLDARSKVRDRVWYDIRVALVTLTGQDFEAIEDWRKFWAGHGASLDPTKLGEATGLTKVAIRKTEESVQFFGQEVFSKNLLFVIDVSGSMVLVDGPGGGGAQRIERAKEQLAQAVKKLPRGARFNVIAYSDKVQPWQKGLQPATPGNVASALKFVNGFQARGATHTDEALELAFNDISVDTIVLLSDGAPARKDNSNTRGLIETILAQVKDVNSSRRVRIDTFGFEGVGTVPPGSALRGWKPPSADDVKAFVEFLKTLASESGGTYRAVE